MTVKEYLKQVRNCDIKIKALTEEVERLDALLTSGTVAPKDVNVKSSGKLDSFSETVAKIVDMKCQINSEIDSFINLRKDIFELIRVLQYPEYEVIYKRYICYQSWEKIALDMNYTYRNVLIIHGKALQRLQNHVNLS